MDTVLKFFNPIDAIANAIYQKQLKKEEETKVGKYLKTITTPEKVTEAIKLFTPKNADEAEKRRIKNIIVDNYVKNLDRLNEEQQKACAKVNNNIIKLAQKANNSNGEIDATIQELINKLDNFDDIVKYAKAAERGQQWLDYTMWQLTSKSTLINISNIDQGTKEYINGICKIFNVPRLYSNFGDADLEFYDPSISGFNNQRFLVNMEALKKRATLSFQSRINSISSATDPVVKKGGYSPITISSFAKPNQGNILVNPDVAVDKATENVLESYLLPYIGERIHWYEKTAIQNKYKLVVRNIINSVPEEYYIWLGYFGQNVLALEASNVLGMKVLVHQNYSEIWEKVLNNCFYQMSEQETNAANQYVSKYFWEYSLVDFSNIPENYIQGFLDIKLNNIFVALQSKGVQFGSNIRYRFDQFESSDKFSMVANDGSVIFVENNNAVYRLNNTLINLGC